MPTVELLLRGYSLTTDQGGWGFSTVTLIRGQRTILVDTGPHGRRPNLRQALAERGLAPEEIDILVLSHAHWDHIQNVDLFPRARIVVHPRELEYARSPRKGDWATPRYFPAMLEGRELLLAAEGLELEPGVRVLETPGHTRGHISVLVDTKNGAAAISADALPVAGSVFSGLPTLIFWDQAQAAASVRKLLRASRHFYPGHDRPFHVGEGSPAQIEYLEGQPTIQISGVLGYGLSNVGVTLAPLPLPGITVVPEQG